MLEAIQRFNASLNAKGYTALDSEQIDCLNDPMRKAEACAMLDDLVARLGASPIPAHDITAMLLAPRLYRADMTPEQFHTQAVETMKREIMAFVSLGLIPRGTVSFVALHDYLDANTLGGFCDEGMQATFNAIFPHDDADSLNDAFMRATGVAQQEIDAWLSSGGIEVDRETNDELFTPTTPEHAALIDAVHDARIIV